MAVPHVVIVHATLAGVESGFPLRSVACTRNVWGPAARPVSSTGDAHAAKAALSSEHWNVDGSLAEKVNAALVDSVADGGPVSIVVCGGVGVSTVHSCVAADGSTSPSASVATTSKV